MLLGIILVPRSERLMRAGHQVTHWFQPQGRSLHPVTIIKYWRILSGAVFLMKQRLLLRTVQGVAKLFCGSTPASSFFH